MSRKVLKVWLVIVGLISTLFAGIPAQAAGTATLPYMYDIVSLKALPNNRAFVLGYVPVGRYKDLVGYAIAADGTIGDPIVFETGARMTYSAIEVSPITVFTDGSVGLAWTAYNDVTGVSTIGARFSADGSTWGAISHPAPTLTSASCSAGKSAYCYYITPRVARDGKGQVAVAYGKKDETWKAFVAVSKDKSIWAAPLVQTGTSTSKIGFIYGLSAGGFETGGLLCYISSCGYWIATVDPKATKFSGKATFAAAWNSYISYQTFDGVQALNSTTAVIPIDASNNDFSFAWITFSTVNGKWSPVKTMKVPGASIYHRSPVSTFDAEGRLTYVYSSRALDASRNATGRDNYLKLAFDPTTLMPTSQLLGDAPTEPFGLITYLRNVYFDADNQLHLVMDQGGTLAAVDAVVTTPGLNSPQIITELRSGEKYFAVTTSNGNQISTLTNDGSMYYSNDENYVQVIRQGDKPRLTSSFAIAGKNQKGATLKMSAPSFAGNNAVDSVTYDWYACKAALTALTYGATPANCVLVSVGSSNTYKLTRTDAGKYITVAATGHIGSLSTIVFSKTTAKIK